jgi:hypothetical protein
MLPALYILAEGEPDELFYERLTERISGQTFCRPEEFRVRSGSNWKTVQAAAKLLLNRFRNYQTKQQIAILISLDNDRAPGHPGGRIYPRVLPELDRKKEPRFGKMQELISSTLGSSAKARNVQVAVAMPVEMVESWLLLLLDKTLKQDDLPPFAKASDTLPCAYYGAVPPPQLKDLRSEKQQSLDVDQTELFFGAANSGDLDLLATQSISFCVFQDDVRAWVDELDSPSP